MSTDQEILDDIMKAGTNGSCTRPEFLAEQYACWCIVRLMLDTGPAAVVDIDDSGVVYRFTPEYEWPSYRDAILFGAESLSLRMAFAGELVGTWEIVFGNSVGELVDCSYFSKVTLYQDVDDQITTYLEKLQESFDSGVLGEMCKAAVKEGQRHASN